MFGLSFSKVRNKRSGEHFVKVYSSVDVLNNDLEYFIGKLEPVNISYSHSESSLRSERIAVLYKVK